MKILYHHRTRAQDGARTHMEELIAALRADGHEVIVVGPAIGDQGTAPASTGRWVPLLRKALPRAAYELLEIAYSWTSWRRLHRAWKTHKPDVLYERYNLYELAGYWLHRRTRLPMLLEVNAPLAAERAAHGGLALGPLARRLESLVWRSADHALPVTDALADHLRAAGVPDERITVIPNGANLDSLDALPDTDGAKRRLGLEGRLVLGFTGYVRDWHGLDKVIDLLADPAMPAQAHLLLVGDGPARPALEAQARRLGVGDRLTVTGVVPRAEVLPHVAAFDIALQPAVTAYASPLKLFEYMALGRAIVAPDQANIREVLRHGHNALLFPPDAADGVRQAVKHLLTDGSGRRSLGAQAAATLHDRGLTWRENARRVEELALGLTEPDQAAKGRFNASKAAFGTARASRP